MLNQVNLKGRSKNVRIEDGSIKFDLYVLRQYKNKDNIYETDIIPVVISYDNKVLFNHIKDYVNIQFKDNTLVGIKGRIKVENDLIIDASQISFLGGEENA